MTNQTNPMRVGQRVVFDRIECTVESLQGSMHIDLRLPSGDVLCDVSVNDEKLATNATKEQKMGQAKPVVFGDLSVGHTFDWIDPDNRAHNSFFARCIKISARKYAEVACRDKVYSVGTIKAKVFHVAYAGE
jgi:hypothetical protein